jgi:hypothetical protein
MAVCRLSPRIGEVNQRVDLVGVIVVDDARGGSFDG